MSQVKALITCRLDCVGRGVPLLLPVMGDGGSHWLFVLEPVADGQRSLHLSLSQSEYVTSQGANNM